MSLRHVLVFIALLLLAGCGGSRQMGDIGGVPVEFEVQLDRSFVKAMENRQGRLGASAGVSVGSGGTRSGLGFGLSFSSTNVYLYGGNGPGQAGLFKKKLKWGVNQFTIPVNVGRKVVFSVVVSGGRSGWESIGNYTVKQSDNALRIFLVESGGSIQAAP